MAETPLPAAISLRQLSKRFKTDRETVNAMQELTLDIEAESFFTLLGPSGCGKSTLLRCLAGLEAPDSGAIAIAGRTVYSSDQRINVPPNKRRIGMVFQSYAIWPHMTVFQNVAFPLQVQKQGDIRNRVMRALAMVELDHVADRYASRLSGGQQQRIAFARAVVAEPSVLLLDEPLSNLDAALREQMRSELRALQQRLRITTVYVTHDQSEALSMSDRIAVMRGGRFVEIAAPEALYEGPRSAFTARFLGGANLLGGTLLAGTLLAGEGGTRIATPLGELVSADEATGAPGSATTLFIRPERIRLAAAGERGPNLVACTLRSQLFVGDSRELELDAGGEAPLRARVPATSAVATGERLTVHIDPADLHLLSEE